MSGSRFRWPKVGITLPWRDRRRRAARQHLARTVTESPGKSNQVLLAVALGALGGSIDRSTWRDPDARARRYLGQLAAWGYTLSAVEQLVLAEGEFSGQDGRGIGATVDDDAAVADEPIALRLTVRARGGI